MAGGVDEHKAVADNVADGLVDQQRHLGLLFRGVGKEVMGHRQDIPVKCDRTPDPRKKKRKQKRKEEKKESINNMMAKRENIEEETVLVEMGASCEKGQGI
jgi:hypothetical protein